MENSHSIRPSGFQEQLKNNVYTGILTKEVIGPVELTDNLATAFPAKCAPLTA